MHFSLKKVLRTKKYERTAKNTRAMSLNWDLRKWQLPALTSFTYVPYEIANAKVTLGCWVKWRGKIKRKNIKNKKRMNETEWESRIECCTLEWGLVDQVKFSLLDTNTNALRKVASRVGQRQKTEGHWWDLEWVRYVPLEPNEATQHSFKVLFSGLTRKEATQKTSNSQTRDASQKLLTRKSRT